MMRRATFTLLVCAVSALGIPAALADDAGVCKDENAAAEVAIEACSRIIKAGKTKGNDLAITYYNRAISYRKKKDDLDGAISDFTDAIRNDPKSSVAYANRGDVWDDKGDQDRAIADLSEAIRINPNYARAYNIRGVIYRNRKDFDRAIADYTNAVRSDPKFALAFINRGNAYKDRGDTARATAG